MFYGKDTEEFSEVAKSCRTSLSKDTDYLSSRDLGTVGTMKQSFSAGSDCKESACNSGDGGSIPGLGRTPGEGNDSPLQYSCLGNPLDRGAWRTIVHGLQRAGHD